MDSTVAEKSQWNEMQGGEKPSAKFFSLKTPYMVQGRMTPVVAKTDNLAIQVKVNAEGGENALHAHLDEDHSFIVLEGQCSIFDEAGNETVLTQYQGVMLPKGAYYRYYNTGMSNMVLLRMSAPTSSVPLGKGQRVNTKGAQFRDKAENKTLPPIVMEGKFFAQDSDLKA